MCDRPAEKAVRSPWTDGAWLMRDHDVRDGWEWHHSPDEAEWWPLRAMFADGSLVEARPTPQEDQ